MSAKNLVCLFGVFILSSCVGLSPTSTPTPALTATEEYVVDGMAIAHVFTWEDINRNGKPDQGERPLPFVTTSIDYPDFLTGWDGWGTPSAFMPGCEWDCSLGKTVAVKVPPGYKATTPTAYMISAESENYFFGFYIENKDAIVSFSRQPAWQKAFINRGTKLLDFQYSKRLLKITIDRNGTIFDDYYSEWFLTDEAYYSVFIFDVLSQLISQKIVDIPQVQIMLLPENAVYLCDRLAIYDSENKYGLEIFEPYCERVQ